MNQTKPHAMPIRDAFDHVSRLFQTGQLRDANRVIEELLADYPDNVNFLHLGGLIKQNVGEFDLAEKLLSTAYALRPEQADLIHNLAVFYLSRNKLDQALPLYEQLLKMVPNQAHIWVNYGHALRQQGKLNDALAAFETAQKLDAEKFDITSTIAMTKRQMANWNDVELPKDKVNASLAPVFLADPFDHRDVVVRAAHAIKPVGAFDPQPIPNQSRIRIGYLSNDLHDHATSYLIAELFALHDRAQFEVFVYSCGIEDQSPVRQRMKLATEHWVECGGKQSTWVADRIFRDRINILIDLKGYTRGGMPDVLAARPANIIMQWLGYPGSMGASFVDYIIADKTLVTDDVRKAYTENVVRLPHSYQINDRQRSVKPPKSRKEYGLPDDAVVLACFNQPYKMTPAVFDVWMSILNDTPKTVLWLFATHDEAIPNLQAEAEKRGVGPSRLIFAKRAPQDQHLARYAVVDVVLDTAPYGGHTTTSDALWVGAPVVSLMGKSFAARVSASLLRAAHLNELVTENLAAYEAKIRELIAKPDERARLKKHLIDNRKSLPLFDTPAFVKALESAFNQAWERARNKEQPKDMDINA